VRALVLAALSISFAATGCSLAVDTSTNQCSVDADCASFGVHPSCQQGVCVSSGLGPPGCFLGEPTQQPEFANQCTTAQTFQFDNCERLHMCDASSLAAAFNANAPPSDLGTVPPPVGNQIPPTVNCTAVAPNLIYLTGSTNLPPLIKAVQPLLYAGSPPYVAIFAPQTSCKGAASILDSNTAMHLIKNVPNNYAFYYDASGAQRLCLLDDPAGNVVDVGESDIYPASCGYQLAPNTADYLGPIQAITMVVPSGSKQTAISAEAAHLVFGVGGDNGRASPWSDAHYYFTRSSGTGTTQLVARSVGVAPDKVWGIDRLSAANLVASMEAVDPSVSESVIGLLSSDFADKSRANLRVLAFQQRGQTYGYLPDSTVDTYDKANVRDGHYPIWGAIHLMAATQNGVPSQAASAFITQFTVPKLERELVSAIIESGFVPSCAMKVNHASELGALVSFKPAFGCGCFYDNQVNGKTSCKTCGGPADCPTSAPACNYGYCEAQ
jgi:hypothetical protein